MPYTVENQEAGDWSVGLKPDTPRSILDSIDIRTYAFASIVVTPVEFDSDNYTDAAMLDAARYTGT